MLIYFYFYLCCYPTKLFLKAKYYGNTYILYIQEKNKKADITLFFSTEFN